MSDLPASDLRCRQCGARLQPSAQWCSLCHATTAEPQPVDNAAPSTEQPPVTGHRRRRQGRRQATKTRHHRTRLVTGVALTAALVTGGAIAISSASSGHHEKKPPLQGPAGDGLGVQPGVGAPVGGPVPVRILH